jgi:hypothetical protein
VRDKVMAHARRIPNYTCVQTIARDWYDYAAGVPPRSCDALLGRRKRAGAGTLIQLATTDRLRLDVALADSREIYSWPGAAKFDDRELDEFVPPGAVGTGTFAATLFDIFAIRDPRFIYEGQHFLDGRNVMEYSFAVTEPQSHYKARAGDQWLITGYTGTLLVDPATADIVSLNVRTEELPAATQACEVDRTLNYSAVRLGGVDYMLPTLTRERFIAQNGGEAENTVTFTACREFRGESSLTFGETPVPAQAKQPAAAEPLLELPPGLPVNVELTSTTRADKAAAGDRIEGRLAGPIRDAQKKRILVPEGSTLEGRLMRVETRYGHPNHMIVLLRWETIAVNGVRSAFSIAPGWLAARQDIADPIGAAKPRIWAYPVLKPSESHYGVFFFSGENVVMQSGLRTQWFTAQP